MLAGLIPVDWQPAKTGPSYDTSRGPAWHRPPPAASGPFHSLFTPQSFLYLPHAEPAPSLIRRRPALAPGKPLRILVVQPSWVGDAVMATPTLRAIRELYPEAHISYLMRRYVKPLYAGMPWADQLITYRTGKTKAKAGKGHSSIWPPGCGRRKFDLAILLPNCFKTALVCKMAGIQRVVGYERDGRGFLLTDKLLPVKDSGKFIPSPIVKYYLGLAHYLGSHQPRSEDAAVRHRVRSAARRREVLARCGLERRPRPPRRRAASRRWSCSTPAPTTAPPSAGGRSISRSWPTGSSTSRTPRCCSAPPRRSGRSSRRSSGT